MLSDARALAVWFLHQEVGLPYEQANLHVLDQTNDCGVDFIWDDKEGKQILIGQVEYDSKRWTKEAANERKAIETFDRFCAYLKKDILPDHLHEAAREAWRKAKRLISQDGYRAHYFFVTPKSLTTVQMERIRQKSGLQNYDFFTRDELIERGEEFLDGQTGMSSFKLPFTCLPLKISCEYGQVFVAPVALKSIHKIVDTHAKQKKLRALFASNVRSYLNVKKRSKEIADAIQHTIERQPDQFLICNNGVTIQCSKATLNDKYIYLERASVSNGCQTVMNVDRYFREHSNANPHSEVLVTVIELKKDAASISSDVAIARNNQNPVDNRDLKSNHFLMVTLHHRLFADKLKGSEKRYYLVRKQGEKQTVSKEEQDAKWKYFWIDADFLARCIAAVLRADPFVSQQGTNDIFGRLFSRIFPAIEDPSHARCKYAYWLVKSVESSYDKNAKWKGIRDLRIDRQKDFKAGAKWAASSLIAEYLKMDFSFSDSLEGRFVEYCERRRFGRSQPELDLFEEAIVDVADASFRLLHAVAKPLLGKPLPKSKGIYSQYEDLFKGPNYDFIRQQLKKGTKISYQRKFNKSMSRLVSLLEQG
ncbi:MAG: AIPR family protein [Acidobacteria bacterium]|nr:AIPR family protein [Acidobacteriota bacterium]